MEFDPNVLSNGLLVILALLQRTIQAGGRNLKTTTPEAGINDIKCSTERMVEPLTILNAYPALFPDKHPNDRSVPPALTFHLSNFSWSALASGSAMC